jgi:putative transposase
MVIKRTSQAVYDPQYHLVWAPKYRKWIVREDIRQRAAELLREIADNFQFEIEEMEVAKDHVHLFLNFPPRYPTFRIGMMIFTNIRGRRVAYTICQAV